MYESFVNQVIAELGDDGHARQLAQKHSDLIEFFYDEGDNPADTARAIKERTRNVNRDAKFTFCL